MIKFLGKVKQRKMGVWGWGLGVWGLGFGVWGLGFGPKPQTPR